MKKIILSFIMISLFFITTGCSDIMNNTKCANAICDGKCENNKCQCYVENSYGNKEYITCSLGK